MARLLEDQSKGLLGGLGIPIPRFGVADNPEEARNVAEGLGCPVVVKALVPVGKRGKAGAVLFASTPLEAEHCARKLLAMTLAHYPVRQVLIEEKLEIEKELYLSITIDQAQKLPVIMASSLGGIDVEEVVREHPDALTRYHVDPLIGFGEFAGREIWCDAGITGKTIAQLATLTRKLFQAFESFDAYLIEINPLVITAQGELSAAAVVMSVDDSSLYRHPELGGKVQMGTERAWRPLTDLEKQMVAVNESDPYRGTARYTEMEGGDIGFMCGGGGGSLMLFDALMACGGSPANYSEFGGNPPEDKVCGLAKGILSKPGVRGLFVAQNITNNTQVDVVARGVIRALQELHIEPAKYPVVVREAGVNEDTARQLFSEYGVEYYGDEITMTQAARRMIEKMRETYPDYGR
ncbi:MAG: ATP-grasp domain-containing protein [Bacillota bacterium]